jgi:hypothetical protein
MFNFCLYRKRTLRVTVYSVPCTNCCIELPAFVWSLRASYVCCVELWIPISFCANKRACDFVRGRTPASVKMPWKVMDYKNNFYIGFVFSWNTFEQKTLTAVLLFSICVMCLPNTPPSFLQPNSIFWRVTVFSGSLLLPVSGTNTFISDLFSYNLSLCSSLNVRPLNYNIVQTEKVIQGLTRRR